MVKTLVRVSISIDIDIDSLLNEPLSSEPLSLSLSEPPSSDNSEVPLPKPRTQIEASGLRSKRATQKEAYRVQAGRDNREARAASKDRVTESKPNSKGKRVSVNTEDIETYIVTRYLTPKKPPKQ